MFAGQACPALVDGSSCVLLQMVVNVLVDELNPEPEPPALTIGEVEVQDVLARGIGGALRGLEEREAAHALHRFGGEVLPNRVRARHRRTADRPRHQGGHPDRDEREDRQRNEGFGQREPGLVVDEPPHHDRSTLPVSGNTWIVPVLDESSLPSVTVASVAVPRA